VAESLGDRRTASYARGYLGTLYEDERRHDEALVLTREAIFAAQQASAPESLYRWQWQAARLHRKMGNVDEALAAYRGAVHTVAGCARSSPYATTCLRLLPRVGGAAVPGVRRSTATAGDRRLGQHVDGRCAGARHPRAARRGPDVVESIKVAELRDYFRDDCVDTALARVTQLDVVSPTAAVVYPILLPDRTELLVTLPSGLRRFVVPVGETAMTREVRQFRQMLERRTTRQYLRPAQQLYQWLVAPLEEELSAAKIDTIVFVPDGSLRTIPMSALHDGKRFLVEKYAVAITRGSS
jgi:tetratricopeptide (TPR) repeat protein